MEVNKISDGIQATIELLESIPVRGRDLEVTGYGIMTAIKNLRVIKEATIKAENYEPEQQKQEDGSPDIRLVPEEEEGGNG